MLSQELQLLRIELKDREKELKSDVKTTVGNLPKHLFKNFTKKESFKEKVIRKDPVGQLLHNLVARKLLRKESSLVKFITGLLLKKVGKTIQKKLV